MSTTEQINAYLAWRSEREGRTVDVSPEAYERDQLIREIFELIHLQFQAGDPDNQGINELYHLARTYELFEEDN